LAGAIRFIAKPRACSPTENKNRQITLPVFVFYCGKDKSLGEQPTSYTTPEFLQQIAFPQRASIARFTDPEKVLALR